MLYIFLLPGRTVWCFQSLSLPMSTHSKFHHPKFPSPAPQRQQATGPGGNGKERPWWPWDTPQRSLPPKQPHMALGRGYGAGLRVAARPSTLPSSVSGPVPGSQTHLATGTGINCFPDNCRLNRHAASRDACTAPYIILIGIWCEGWWAIMSHLSGTHRSLAHGSRVRWSRLQNVTVAQEKRKEDLSPRATALQINLTQLQKPPWEIHIPCRQVANPFPERNGCLQGPLLLRATRHQGASTGVPVLVGKLRTPTQGTPTQGTPTQGTWSSPRHPKRPATSCTRRTLL